MYLILNVETLKKYLKYCTQILLNVFKIRIQVLIKYLSAVTLYETARERVLWDRYAAGRFEIFSRKVEATEKLSFFILSDMAFEFLR